MGLRITVDPYCCGTPYLALGNKAKVVHIASGVDISDVVRSIDISIREDEFVTAKITCYVGEINIKGVESEEIRDWLSDRIKMEEQKRMIREE